MIKRIKVGMASCGLAAGAQEVYDFIKTNYPDAPLASVGCIGHCYAEPIVEVETASETLFYERVKPDKIFCDKLMALENFSRLGSRPGRADKERILVTRLAGRIDPNSIDEYIAAGGFAALAKVRRMKPLDLISEIIASGLRGRGGGGFPTGQKWKFMAVREEKEKVLICNADEGDPGAFMDRSLMESVPHQVLEGMLIAAHATGAKRLFIYCRAEYPLALRNLEKAISAICGKGLLRCADGEITVNIKEGAGAFVCGEETALIHSLEGKRGTPRFRPPYPAEQGFLGLPTAVNNVETLANVPLIITDGAAAFAAIGTSSSKGTKLFALAGDLKHPGLVEVPMGMTLGEVVHDIAGAEPGSVKAVQTGGPSGGCIPVEHFSTPIDYDSLKSLGAIMGSGGMIAIGSNRCMVETARYFIDFTARESCGKCTFCRVGTKRMLEILERITQGEGTLADIEQLELLGRQIVQGSLCGLGQSAPNPVLATLRYFRHEYLEHIEQKQCSARACNALVDLQLSQKLCNECRLCIKTCPISAISDQFVIDNSKCSRCNSYIEVCPKDAIARVARGGAGV